MNTRRNRRAFTGMSIRDNSVYGISIRVNGRGIATLPMWYRRHVNGNVITGPAYQAAGR